jgi:hypothetical protein
MSNQASYLTKCIDAINVLRKDVAEGQIAFYHLDQLPSGTLPPSLADKCSSAVVAVSGNGTSSYVAVLPQRVDIEKNTGLKVYDSDPIIFASKAGEPATFPTGVFVHHSDYPGRTEPIAGFETSSYGQTIAALKTELITGQQPLSGAHPKYLAAISHGIAHFDQNLGQQFSAWSLKTETGERPDI